LIEGFRQVVEGAVFSARPRVDGTVSVIMTTGSSSSSSSARRKAPSRRASASADRDHQIEVIFLEDEQSLLAVLRGVHVVAVALEAARSTRAQIRLHRRDQDLFTFGQHRQWHSVGSS